MNIEILSEVTAGEVTKATEDRLATAALDLHDHENAIEVHAGNSTKARRMRDYILELLTSEQEPAEGPLMRHFECPASDHPQIELLSVLNVLRNHYTMVSITHERITHERIGDAAFARALRYFAEVIENE